MKPVRLEIQGFTAFREATTVDFEGRRLFVITGPTGAGKSSLLDAITWALYGEVPRVGASTKQLISHHAPSMSVQFEFDSRGRRYRISRVARQTGAATVRLERQRGDGSWEQMADRVREANEEVKRALGLDYRTFTRTILLPQGAFDSFLKGDAKDRREILGRLLGLEVYSQARSLAVERATRARDRAAHMRAQLEQMALADPQAVEALEKRHAELEACAKSLEARRAELSDLADLARAERDARNAAQDAVRAAEAAEKERTEAQRRVAEATQAREDAAALVEALQAERSALGYDAAAHDALRTRVRLLDLWERDRQALERAREALAEAERAERLASAEAAKAKRAAKAAAAEAARTESARAEAAQALSLAAGRAYRATNRLGSEATSAEEEQRRAEHEAAEHEQRAKQLASLQQRLDALDRERADAVRAASEAVAAVEAAERAAVEAQARREQAAEALAAARARLDALRIEHAAAMLQRAVQPGDPCPVCGQPVDTVERHEAPDLDDAESAVRGAEVALNEAWTAAERTREEAASAKARSEAAARDVANLERRRGELEGEAGFAGATDVAQAVESARSAAAEATARAEAERARAHARREAANALRLALASVPREVTVSGEAQDDDAPPDVLQSALNAYQQAADDARAAASALTEAEGRMALAANGAEAAQRARTQAARAVEDAERRLAEHEVDESVEPQALREALAAADDQARRARELEAELGKARERLAAAEASREGRAAEADRARLEAERRAEACREAQAAVSRAASAFADGWQRAGCEGEPSFEGLREVMVEHEHRERSTAEELGGVRERLEHARRAAADAQRIREEASALEREGHLANALARELQSNNFIAYVQQEAMALLAADASDRLAAFSGGRYTLAAEGDEFLVVDRLNGDERRSVKTLSGGETFLASLALALALSEHLPTLSGAGAAVSLESLFLDEGFGALDAESLDLAVQGLETLAGGTRMIGVISHVPELAERLPERIEVVRNGNSSVVRA